MREGVREPGQGAAWPAVVCPQAPPRTPGSPAHVGGQVERPGVFPLTGKITVLDSVFEAGGYLPRARLNEVLIIRKNPYVDEPYLVIPVNIETILDGTDVEQNIPLLPYDAVYVPSSPIANVNSWVDLYIRQNLPFDFGIRATAVTF